MPGTTKRGVKESQICANRRKNGDIGWPRRTGHGYIDLPSPSAVVQTGGHGTGAGGRTGGRTGSRTGHGALASHMRWDVRSLGRLLLLVSEGETAHVQLISHDCSRS